MKNLILNLIIVLIFIYALFNYNLHPLTIGILGAINILSLSISYINLKNKK